MAKSAKDAKLKAQLIWPGATVFDRGKGHISHQHPTDPNRFMLDTQVGGRGWHFGDGPFTDAHEVDTAWVNADPILDAPWQKKMVLADYNAYAFREPTLGFDQGQLIEYRDAGESVNFQPTQLQWTNDLGQLSPIADPQAVAATVSDDMLTWVDAYGPGIDFQWQTQTARLMKYVHIDSLANLGAPPQLIIDGGNPVLRVELLFQKSAGLEIWVDGALWNEKANNPKTTLSNVEFRAGGVPVWWFKSPLAWDSGGHLDDVTKQETHPALRLRKTGPNLFVEIRTPWSWLQQANYPVVIDTTIDQQVEAGADDTFVSNDSTLTITSGVAYVGRGPGINNASTSARFPSGISGLSGATINTSYISARFQNTGTACKSNIYADDAAAPTAPTTYAEFVGKTRTTAFVAWDDATSADAFADSPSINSVIQELADSYDPSAIQIFWENDGSANNNYQSVRQYEGFSTWGLQLYIEYTAGSTEPAPNVSDAVTTGETVTVDPVAPTNISELDAVTVGDTPTVVRPLEEDRNVSEQDDITVGDTPTVSLLDAETLSVSEQDDITVGDTPTVSVPEAAALDVSETDPITVGDTATLAPVYSIDIDVSDGVTVTDTPTVQVPVEGEWYVSEGDAVTVGETVTLSPVSPTNVSELDAVTVGDTPTVFRVVEEAYFISESDGVTVVDTPTLGPVTPTEISEIDAITVVDTPTVTFFEPILTLSVGDAVSITDLSTVRFPSDMLGLDKPKKKPYEYEKQLLDLEPIVRPLDPAFAMRQEQKSVMKANAVAESLARQNEQAAAERVSAMLAREKVDKDKADRRRASSLHNLAKAQLAKEAKAARQDEINKTRKKNLQKARRKLKRQRKKK